MVEVEMKFGTMVRLAAAGAVGIAALAIAGPRLREASDQTSFVSTVDERANAVAANHGDPVDMSKFTAEEREFTNADSVVYEATQKLSDNPTKKQKMAAGCLVLTASGLPWGEENAQRWENNQVTAGANSCRDKIQGIIDKDTDHKVTFRLVHGLVNA